MKKNTFKLVNATTTTTTHTFENNTTAERLLIEATSFPAPPSEETVARLNAIGREYPFCAYMKQKNLYLL
ncbi:hypothetical protein [Niastella sp. OAS944]|uniref:hypothetical protein n=1 Tax=Niastella sp. OAS944 TaxID=2664089 RepID=UPI0034889EF2|nr:hypothetical protein [Chitinophagaceae bacterium OAS944]